ncbi:MAG: hypothetical protein M3Q07_10710 [Pseudobdellovibrionaceae bacterium]|nr:hypothetical protein [Pseudobdellovibrionaceae bacterium]
MKRLLLLALFAQPAFSADCLFYKELNRGGTPLEQNSNQNSTYQLATAWNDQISSVWVKDGFYAVLFDNPKFQVSKVLYLYGSGLSFSQNGWARTSGTAVNGGTGFNLDGLGYNKVTSSVLCLKD